MASDRENHINRLVERGMQQKKEQASKPRPMQTRGEVPKARVGTVTPRRREEQTSKSSRSPIEPRGRVRVAPDEQTTERGAGGAPPTTLRSTLSSSGGGASGRGGVGTTSDRTTSEKATSNRATSGRGAAKPVVKAKNSEPSAEKSSSPSSQAYPDRNIWMSLGLLFVAGYLALCCVSYLVYWDVDQSASQWGRLFVGLKSSADTMNWGGRLGAILSQRIMGDGFGIFGLMLPVSVFLLAIQVLRIPTFRVRKGAITALLLMVLGSVVMGHFWGDDTAVLGGGLGGEIGVYAASWLGGMVGFEGTTLLVLVLFVAMIYFAASDSVRLAARKIAQYIAKYKEYQAVKSELERLKQEEAIHLAALRSEQAKSALVEKQEEEANKLRSRLGSSGDRYDHVDTSALTYTDLPESRIETGQEQAIDTTEQAALAAALLGGEAAEASVGMNNADTAQETELADGQNGQGEQVQSEQAQGGEMSADGVRADAGSLQAALCDVGSQGYLAGYDAQGNEIIYYWLGSDYAAAQIEPLLPVNEVDCVGVGVDGGGSKSGLYQEPEDEQFTTYDKQVAQEAKAVDMAIGQAVAPVQVEPYTPEYQAEEPFQTDEPSAIGGEKEYFHGADGEVVTRFSPSKDDPNFIVEQKISEMAVDDDTINLTELYDPTLELASYIKPPIELMDNHMRNVNVTQEELVENKNRIVTTLENFGIRIDTIEATIGPTVTLYEIIPAPGVRISKIKNLEDDIALSLSALGIRIIAPIPGKGTIGIEVPNKDKEVVSMYSVIKSAKFQDSKAELPIALGKTIQNETFVLDLAKMPHLLVAGATGQGKSVGLNAIITSLLYKKHPSELKFVLVDPKKVELTLYSRLEKHFLAKLPDATEAIITDTQKVIYTLNSLCIEMDSRYDLLKAAKVRNIIEYNDKFINRRLNPNKGHRFLPYFVVVVDEFADLIMTAGREVETPIARIAQLARAVGIHLIIATQRPTTNIITGVIKANFPARIAFRVSSMVDSRTILDSPGANQLVGKGDMLVSTGSEVTRVQCAFIDTPEVDRIAEHIGSQRGYPTAYELPEYVPEGEATSSLSSEDMGKRDSLFEEVARYVVANDNGSASTIQRKFSIGFNRAGRIVDQLESAGILGRPEGSKPRQVLIQDPMSLEMILDNL